MGGKFDGKVGFVEMQQTAPDVWQEVVTERSYFGDVLRNQSRSREGQGLNNNLVADHRISIVEDPYAHEKYPSIRYVWFMGAKWQVKTAEANSPRIILTLGEVYNEQSVRVQQNP